MNTGSKSNIVLDFNNLYGCSTIEAVCAATGLKSNTAIKYHAIETDLGHIVKGPYIHPRCLWHPKGHYFGTQKLILMTQILYRCVHAEPRIWTPCGREGSATIIQCGDEKEALFVDYGATPRCISRKLARWCEAHDITELAALGVVVPTMAKSEAINRLATDLPLPIRYCVSEDLRRLTFGA